jgi:Flp pilus assembly protein protease CpaA
MSFWIYFAIIAALYIIPTLIAGAISDIRIRTFPKEYWVWTRIASGFFCILMYLGMLSEGLYFYAGALLVISCFTSLFFLFMGIRFGSGGDWRAMCYIAWLTPLLVVPTFLLSLLVAVFHAMYEMNINMSGTPREFRSIPFAVSIFFGFILSLLLTLTYL